MEIFDTYKKAGKVSYDHEGKELIETHPQRIYMLELADKDFINVCIKKFRGIKKKRD